jgi:AcrR family transcriptional regulator
MARLTRAESQARTRAQLVATAKQLFFEQGYHPTTLEKVADAAGFSKGAVYSNFRNKDELCVAVLQQQREERMAEILSLIAEPDAELRLRRFQDWAQQVVGDPGWTSLEVEFAMHARRDEQLRADLGARLDNVLTVLAAAADTAVGVDSKLPGRELATVLLALGAGLGLFRSINPSIPVDGLIDTLGILTQQDAR